MSLRRYPRSAIACSTRAAVSGATALAPFITRDTVITLTPAAAPTPRMVGRAGTDPPRVWGTLSTSPMVPEPPSADKSETTLSRSGNDMFRVDGWIGGCPRRSTDVARATGEITVRLGRLDSYRPPSQNPG